MTQDDIDTSPVKCPNGHLIAAGLGKTRVVPRQYTFVTGEVGTRNYCERCGTEMVSAESPVTIA